MNRPFFDTSILIAGMIDFGESSRNPIRILDLIADGKIEQASTAWHCCLEFYSVVTRLPEEYRLPAETAAAFLQEEIMQNLGFHILDTSESKTLFTNAAHQRIVGGRIYDFHIGTTALSNQASVIVTENKKHFLNFAATGTPVLNAREYLDKIAS